MTTGVRLRIVLASAEVPTQTRPISAIPRFAIDPNLGPAASLSVASIPSVLILRRIDVASVPTSFRPRPSSMASEVPPITVPEPSTSLPVVTKVVDREEARGPILQAPPSGPEITGQVPKEATTLRLTGQPIPLAPKRLFAGRVLSRHP